MKRQGERVAGFTLLEMLVVLAILAMVSAAGASFVRPRPDALALDSAALNLAAYLRSARTHAMQVNRDASFTIDVEGRRYWTETLPERFDIPKSASVSLYSASSERVEETVGRIKFFADGSSTGGRIQLKSMQRRLDVTVDWLTGATHIDKASLPAIAR
jgi:general secretion pathway protein H